MTSDKTKKPWDGRFVEPTDQFVEQFTEAISYDKRLAYYDIAASIAHVKMLEKTKIISQKECDEIVAGLKQIEEEIASNQFKKRSLLSHASPAGTIGSAVLKT